MERYFNRLILRIYALVSGERAVTSIEYALIASLIAVVIIAGVSSVGTSLSTKFLAIGNAI
ncbi:MAG: Flp family type IVb pilin [Acidocella sp.]|nr:Flp family type IVb pilin [Acidocella sp.]